MFAAAHELYPLLVCGSVSYFTLDYLIQDFIGSDKLETDRLELFVHVVSTICWDVRDDPLADSREVVHFSEDFLNISDELRSRPGLGSWCGPWLVPWETTRVIEVDWFRFELVVTVD